MKKVYLLLFLLFCLVCTQTVAAEESGKFIVILLDQLSLSEIAQSGGGELTRLFAGGAEALLNVRTDKGIESHYTYTAFGAGSRGEKYGAVPGLLGQLLVEDQKTIAVLGNSDYGSEERREVVTITGNNNGYLFFDNTGSDLLLTDPTFPGRLRTHYSKLEADFRAAYVEHDLLLVEIGDIARIKTGLERGEVTVPASKALIRATLARFDYFLNQVVDTANPQQDVLMLVALTPDPGEAQKGDKLSWVLLTGKETGQGLLTTGTTRRSGLATISDLAPTILSYFHIPVPSVMNGQPLYSVKRGRISLNHLLRFNNQIYRTSEWRPWYIKGFILIQIIVIILAILIFFGRKWVPRWGWRLSRVLLLSIMGVPAGFLLISPYWMGSFYGYLATLLGVVFGTAILVESLAGKSLVPVSMIVTFTCLLLFTDIVRESPWISRSLLGYCPVIGARFYGIGNEFMGILIGGTLIGWTALLERFHRLHQQRLLWTPVIFLGVILIIGAPFLGANFGGILTAMAAFGLTYVLMFERTRRKKIMILSFALLFAVLSIILLSDTYGWTGEQSHLGRTIRLVKDQGATAMTNIIWRKLSMNLKLLRWTIWTRVLLSFIVVLALLFKRPRGVMYELVQQYPNLTVGFVGVLVGSIVTMLVNDSGVVAAATLLFFAIFALLYLVFNQLEQYGDYTFAKKKI